MAAERDRKCPDSTRETESHNSALPAAVVQQILDLVPSPIFVFDGNARCLIANTVAASTLGKEPNELVGTLASQMGFPDEDADRLSSRVCSVASSGSPSVFVHRNRCNCIGEFSHCRLVPLIDGETRGTVVLCKVSRFGDETNNDAVTQRKRAEQQLAASEARNRAILASAVDPIITIDAFGLIQAASDSVQRVFGWTARELIGKNITIVMPEPVRSRHAEYLARYRTAGSTGMLGQTREQTAVRKDGSLVAIEMSISRVDLPGQDLPLFTGIIHDITERTHAQETLAHQYDQLEDLIAERTAALQTSHEQLRTADRLASIGTLAAGMGHDMGNILLPIRCHLDALTSMNLQPDALGRVEAVREWLHYLKELADGLHMLAMDPEEAGSGRQRTNLPDWWKRVGPLLARGVPKRITVHATLPHDIPPVAIPAHKLTQTALNLVVNSTEAISEAGHITVWAEASADQKTIRFGVTDDGIGMAPEILRQAIDPFFTTKSRGLSTGLGLSLVHGIAKSTGGSLNIESSPQTGTTVVLTVPIATNLPSPVDTDENAISATVAIEDHRIAAFAAALLEAGGMHVRFASPDEPPAGDLWITEPGPHGPQAAVDFLNQNPARRVVIYGQATNGWNETGATVVSPADGLERLRAVLHGCTQTPREEPL